MSNNSARVVAFVLNLISLVILVKCIHETLLSPGYFDGWWFGAMAALIGYDQTTRWDERLKHDI